MLFLCIVSGEAPAQARPLLARCVQTLLALATTALPQDWDQTLDLPQVSMEGAELLAAVAHLGTGWPARGPLKGAMLGTSMETSG